jgi:hypothetical protein
MGSGAEGCLRGGFELAFGTAVRRNVNFTGSDFGRLRSTIDSIVCFLTLEVLSEKYTPRPKVSKPGKKAAVVTAEAWAEAESGVTRDYSQLSEEIGGHLSFGI